ncbi:hypothetical protein BV22DRAFT_1072646 [Leucogyrophana mollusca]|uniref:Uncharacterized protein n=1 Tax=Leucogyrophana mollusca TaxID=85980 RepID=A0ACB8B7T0_9AGAM|nr:hypothetical protein BV22DRAFT_1072646 [Leucogyrophana mollusca]
MSAQSISRWNAIPMSRPEGGEQDSSQITKKHPILPYPFPPSFQRSRTDGQESDEDDNVSLVSRSPSPQPDPMDTEDSLAKYDEYIRGEAREVITVETKLKSSNKGFAMLAKLGWTEGQPLGLSGDGRVDPIPFQIKRDSTGLGKLNQDVRMIETTVSQRRGLDSERQRKETEEQRKARQDVVAKREAVKSEISDVLKPFYCSLCDKQFQNVAQYDEHTNSYAHHHKARLRDMQANQRMVPQEELDKRKEKERKREEKELRKIAKAAGIKMAKPTVVAGVAPAPSQAATTEAAPVAGEAKPTGFKKAGWASVDPAAEGSRGRGGWAPADSPAPSMVPAQDHTGHVASTPSFRTAGWTSLDTGSSQPFPPTPPTAHPPPPPPPVAGAPPPPPPTMPQLPPPPSHGGWASTFSGSQGRPTVLGPPSHSSGWMHPSSGVPPRSVGAPPPPPPSGPPPFPPSSAATRDGRPPMSSAPPPPGPRGWNSAPTAPPPSSSAPAPTSGAPSAARDLAVPTAPRQEGKSGWQQWKQNSGTKRR